MNATISLFISGMLVLQAAALYADATHNCYYDGKRYEFKITAERQAQCPRWDPERDANPPVAAATALAKATKFIAAIKTADRHVWEFEDLALVKGDAWSWRARYRLTPQGGYTGSWPTMQCWILMDGAVVEPTITQHNK